MNEDTVPRPGDDDAPASGRVAPAPGIAAGFPPPGDLIAARIMRMIEQRRRYKYVRPRVLRDGDGWKIVSPNCSRNIDAQGGEIDIAWFLPLADGRWQAHARDHASGTWIVQGDSAPLPDVLSAVCADPSRVFWP